MIIGITGLKGAGKDSVAEVLINEFGYHKMAFADTLKDMVAVAFGWDRKMLEGTTPEDREVREKPDEFWSKELGRQFSPRNALEIFGTNLLRDHFYINFWIACLKKRLKDLGYDKVVITDVRFANEIKAIRELGGEIWRVTRGDNPKWFNIAAYHNLYEPEKPFTITGVHASEYSWQGIDNPDFFISNNETLEDLHNKVRSLMER